mmetsp:Transcript_16474/g.62649  ORF Transcript_16474/g.62649 Transcript_16474/m.62649 type:complete len:263 (+) Transcript_16474:561-1349(+)
MPTLCTGTSSPRTSCSRAETMTPPSRSRTSASRRTFVAALTTRCAGPPATSHPRSSGGNRTSTPWMSGPRVSLCTSSSAGTLPSGTPTRRSCSGRSSTGRTSSTTATGATSRTAPRISFARCSPSTRTSASPLASASTTRGWPSTMRSCCRTATSSPQCGSCASSTPSASSAPPSVRPSLQIVLSRSRTPLEGRGLTSSEERRAVLFSTGRACAFRRVRGAIRSVEEALKAAAGNRFGPKKKKKRKRRSTILATTGIDGKHV